jgi:hypothetical protein
MIVIKESSYLYFSDESSCRPFHSLCLHIDGDLLVADVMVSASTVNVHVLPPVWWVPLDFFDNIVIRVSRLIRTGPPLLLAWPSLLLLLARPGGRRSHRHFSPGCGVRQTTLGRAQGGRVLLGHILTSLRDVSLFHGQVPFTQCTHKTLLGRHLPRRLLLGHFHGRHVDCITSTILVVIVVGSAPLVV